MKFIPWVFGSLTCVVLSCGPALAADRYGAFEMLDGVDDVILLDGDIDRQAVRDFRRTTAARPNAKVLILNSNGGEVSSALQLAAEIRRRGMATAVPSIAGCFSACVYLFFAGSEHVVYGRLGVHQVHSTDRTTASAYSERVQTELVRYDVPEGVIEKMVETAPGDMYVFSRHDIAALGINRVNGGDSRAAEVASRW